MATNRQPRKSRERFSPTRETGRHRRWLRMQPWGLPWLVPALVLSVGLLYYCIGYTGVISTWDWDGISASPEHVGLDNYIRIAQDPIFWNAIQHTIIFFLSVFVGQTFVGFLFAVLMHSKIRLAIVYKVIIFVPVVLAPAITSPVFRQMYAPDGQFNWVLTHIGLGFLAQPWIAQPSTALFIVIVITIWHGTGITFVLYYAGLGHIDPSVLEAARIDGAGNIRTIVSVIWPSLRGTTAAIALLAAIASLKTFDTPYLVTGTVGGPDGSTEFLGTYIYRMSIPNDHMGYGAALSVVLLIVALLMGVILMYRRREKEVVN